MPYRASSLSSALRCAALALTLACSGVAGDPILFSKPTRDVRANESDRRLLESLTDREVRFSVNDPEASIPLPPVLTPLRPDRKAREQLEQERDWMFPQPEETRSKNDPLAPAPDDASVRFGGDMADRAMERIFGRQSLVSPARPKPDQRLDAMLSPEPDREEKDNFSTTGSGERRSRRSDDAESTVRSIFDRRPDRAERRNPALAEALRQELAPVTRLTPSETRRAEFHRLLNMPLPEMNGPRGALFAAEAAANTPKILPGFPSTDLAPAPGAKSSPFASSEARSSLGLPFDESRSRLNSPPPANDSRSRQPEPARPSERPRTIEYPNRKF